MGLAHLVANLAGRRGNCCIFMGSDTPEMLVICSDGGAQNFVSSDIRRCQGNGVASECDGGLSGFRQDRMNARQACGKHFADGGKVKKTVS